MMIEMGIAEVQNKFTKLLSTAVTIVDRKSHKKKAVILPYEMYEKLARTQRKEKVFRDDAELVPLPSNTTNNYSTKGLPR